MTAIVVHYKELALKGHNRSWFIQILIRNIRAALAGIDVVSVRSVMGRIEIQLGANAPADETRARLSRVFGIANFSYAARSTHDFEPLAGAIVEAMGPRQTESFRVSVRRTDKRFPLTSPQIEREVGGLIKQATGWRVDLDHPALEIHIE